MQYNNIFRLLSVSQLFIVSSMVNAQIANITNNITVASLASFLALSSNLSLLKPSTNADTCDCHVRYVGDNLPLTSGFIGILNALARSSLRTYDSRMPLTQQRFIMPGYTDVVVEMDVEPLMGMTWGCAVEALSDAFDGLLYKYERNQPAEYLWRVQRAGVNMGAISIHKAPVGSLPVEGNGTISSSRLVLNGNESAGADGIALGGKEKRDIISCRAGLKLRNGIADNVKSPVDNSLQVGNNSTDLDDIGNIKVELTFRGEPMGPNSLMFVMNAAILRFAQEDAMTVISMGEVFRRYGSHVHIFGVPLAGPQFGAEWTYLSMTLGFVDMMDTVFKANKLESFGWSLINKGVLVAGGVAREQKDLG